MDAVCRIGRAAELRQRVADAAARPRTVRGSAGVPEVGGSEGGVPGVPAACVYHGRLNVSELCRDGCPLARRLTKEE